MKRVLKCYAGCCLAIISGCAHTASESNISRTALENSMVIARDPDPDMQTEMNDVSQTIQRQRATPPVTLPNPEITSSNHFPQLEFTITALSTQSFASLFSENTSALDVASTWLNNVHTTSGAASVDLKREVKNFVEALMNHPELTFADLVDQRLQGLEPGDLRTALDGLLTYGFQFPLFITTPEEPLRHNKLALLNILVQKHVDTKADDGGLGNLTWHQLFHTGADPDYFSQGKIFNTMARQIGTNEGSRAIMQGHILPHPDPKFLGQLNGHASASLFTDGGSDHCCCNYAHTGIRTCASFGGQNCTSCGTYCCLAGVQWCPDQYHDHGA